MEIRDVSVPEVYKESQDFRFFLKWFEHSLSKIQYDTENFFDLYDALRCPQHLLWVLADTMGFKYDSRLPSAFNRLVLLYFMSMIRNKGSKDGVTLAAEANLAQFVVQQNGEQNDILYDRLEDTSIPVNSAYVTPHTAEGFIDVVYFSSKTPKDACIEYVRPLGMFIFQQSGVRFDAKTKISIDARLTDERDSRSYRGGLGLSENFGPTQVGHYSREDYARLQKGPVVEGEEVATIRGWERNSTSFTFNPYVIQDPNYGECSRLYIGDAQVSERVYTVLDVNPNTEYSISFGYRTDAGDDLMNRQGEFQMFVAPYSELSKVKNINPDTGRTQNYMYSQITRLGRSNKLVKSATYQDYFVSFNSGNNTQVVLALDWGAMRDPDTIFGYPYNWYYANVYFTKIYINWKLSIDKSHTRREVWQRNSEYEGYTSPFDLVNPGYRALYSLQLANNSEVVKALIGNSEDDVIFSLGFGPNEDIGTHYVEDYLKAGYKYEDHYSNGNVVTDKAWNLRYDETNEKLLGDSVYTVQEGTILKPQPAVNPAMIQLGDAISMNQDNTEYTKNDNGDIIIYRPSDE